MTEFEKAVEGRIAALMDNKLLRETAHAFLTESVRSKYSYNFHWLSRPIIQYPQDIVAMQELIWKIKPDLIVEAGIAHGGSLIMNASILAMIDYCEAVERGETLDPRASNRRALGIDIEIRAHNRTAIDAHPLSHMIDMIEGSSIDKGVIARVYEHAIPFERILVSLDSNHTHDHVLEELEAYAPLTSKGSYCVVFDTFIEDLPRDMYPDRRWGVGNNPKTAVREYLRRLAHEGRKALDGDPLHLSVDRSIEHKLLITVAADGYLQRT